MIRQSSSSVSQRNRIPARCEISRRLSRGLVILAVCGGAFSGTVFADDAPADATQTTKPARKQRARREERVRRLETALAAGTAAPAETGRYQWRTIGEQLVVLDTQTGATRVVELTSEPALQHVHVGQAWVVVTVLGNVSQRPAESAALTSARKPPASPPAKPVKTP